MLIISVLSKKILSNKWRRTRLFGRCTLCAPPFNDKPNVLGDCPALQAAPHLHPQQHQVQGGAHPTATRHALWTGVLASGKPPFTVIVVFKAPFTMCLQSISV